MSQDAWAAKGLQTSLLRPCARACPPCLPAAEGQAFAGAVGLQHAGGGKRRTGVNGCGRARRRPIPSAPAPTASADGPRSTLPAIAPSSRISWHSPARCAHRPGCCPPAASGPAPSPTTLGGDPSQTEPPAALQPGGGRSLVPDTFDGCPLLVWAEQTNEGN